jgi:hypothetical protein
VQLNSSSPVSCLPTKWNRFDICSVRNVTRVLRIHFLPRRQEEERNVVCETVRSRTPFHENYVLYFKRSPKAVHRNTGSPQQVLPITLCEATLLYEIQLRHKSNTNATQVVWGGGLQTGQQRFYFRYRPWDLAPLSRSATRSIEHLISFIIIIIIIMTIVILFVTIFLCSETTGKFHFWMHQFTSVHVISCTSWYSQTNVQGLTLFVFTYS